MEVADFADRAMLSEPHAYMKRLREEAPVTRAMGPDGSEFYAVTSYALIQEVTRRTEIFSNKIGHMLFAGGTSSERIDAVMAQDSISPGLLLVTDDPEHKRYRALVNAAFAQGKVAHLAPTIERVVDELIDGFIERGECDFVNEFAVLLPTYLIADILGLERKDFGVVRLWSDAVITIVSRMGTEEQEFAAAKMVLEFRRFILRAIDERRAAPKDDLISDLIAVRVEGMEPLTNAEIAPITFEIAVAGNETTRNTLMSGLVRLLRSPDQLDALAEDPSLTANAVEEMLRFETPATSMWRIATEDTILGGVAIPAGASVLLRFDAANRDPEMFEEPDRFDITRKNALRHIAFGAPGIHRCLGQMLARKEMGIAWPKLLTRLRNIRVIEDKSSTEYWPGLLHRGIGPQLHIAFDPGEKLLSGEPARDAA
jgi:cytochrome P450